MLRYVLLILGLLVLSFLIWHIGPAHIYEAVSRLGPLALLAILIPSVMMYLVEAYGWKVTMGASGQAVPFWRVLLIRSAGEVVNLTTPTAYVGGEPLKAYLLKRHHVPMVEGLASVVIAKTTMTIAEVLFILLGIALAFWILGGQGSPGQIVLAAGLSVGLLMFGTGAFVVIQRRGLFSWILGLMRKMGIRIAWVESQEDKLRELDRTILDFYNHHQRAFYASTVLYFLGWMAEALEVFLMMVFLGEQTTAASSIAIGALSVFIKGGTFFIPGSLGAQDGGNLLLLKAFGYSDVTGLTFALLRRFRELVWIAIGLGALAMVGGRSPRDRIG